MKVRAQAIFQGRVQGVYFRDTARKHAAAAGVAGWVRNLPDGRVETVLEGERSAVEEVLHRCRTEQPHARVTAMDVKWEEFRGDLLGFTIRG